MHLAKWEEAYRHIFLSMDVEDMALLDCPCMGVHKEPCSVTHILYNSTDVTIQEAKTWGVQTPEQASAEQCTCGGC